MKIGMKKILQVSFWMTILALAFGIFYREYTKFLGFEGETMLSFAYAYFRSSGDFAFAFYADYSADSAYDKRA